MRDYDFLRVIGATVLAAGVAVMSQDPSFRVLPAPIEASMSDSQYRELMLTLTHDPLGDKARQFKGDMKSQWVNFTDDDLLEIDGNYDRFLAKISERYGDRKDEIKQWVVEWFDKSARIAPQPAQHG